MESTAGNPGGVGAMPSEGYDPENLGVQFPNRDESSMEAHQQSTGSSGKFNSTMGGNGDMTSVGPRTGEGGGLFEGSERTPGADPNTLKNGGKVLAGGTAGNRLGSALDEGSMASVGAGSPSRSMTSQGPGKGNVSGGQILVPGMPEGQASAGVSNDMMKTLPLLCRG